MHPSADNARPGLYDVFKLCSIGGSFLLHGKYQCLEKIGDYWEEIGFAKWKGLGLSGVYRRVTVRKGSLLGEVARYYADDYIIWEHMGDESVRRIFREWKGEPEVMVHRILLLDDETWKKNRQKSFRWGFRGWVDVFAFSVGDEPLKRFADLAHWASMGMAYSSKRKDVASQPGGGACAGA